MSQTNDNFAQLMSSRVEAGSRITLDKYFNLVGQNFIIRIIFIVFLLLAVENAFAVLLLWYIFNLVLGFAYRDMLGFPYYFAFITGKVSMLDKSSKDVVE